MADGGTVFLDEIGDLHPHNQGKLLLFMDKGVFYRLGGIEKLKADVRIIAATNKNLLFEMKHGRFRQDLYFRISTLEIYIPPLRERNEDIPIIVESILKRESDRVAVNKSFSPEALDKMVAYHWPGNIRELENVVKKALVICDGYRIKAEEIIFYNIYRYSPSNHSGSENHLIFQEYKKMVEEGKSFWEVIHKPFLKIELKREEVVEIIRKGLREAGNYRKLMELFNAGRTQNDYRKFMKRFIHEIVLDKVGVLLFCARMLIKMNKTNKAKKLCLEILKNNINERDKIKIQALLGDIYYKRGDVNGAIEQYSSAIFLAEKTKNYDLASIAYHQVGVMFFKEGRIDLALGNISRSIKLCEKTERNYKLGESYYQLGKIYEKKEQWKLALRAYNKALIFKKKVEDKEHYDPSDIYYRMILISNKLSNSKNSTAKLSS